MPNMSYCRFYNTYQDLKDCKEALEDNNFDELSDTEKRYAIKLVQMCANIADNFLDEADSIEND